MLMGELISQYVAFLPSVAMKGWLLPSHVSWGQGAPQTHARLHPTTLGLECLEVEPPASDPLPGVAQRQGEYLGRL